MKEAMKHRLVGTAVIVALGIIAWPVIFDTTPVREMSQRSEVPEGPEIERFVVPEPQPLALPPAPDSDALRAGADLSGGQPARDPEQQDAPVIAGDDKPVLPARGDSHGLPEQWALQLGVFGELQNAREVRDRAQQAGFHAILQSVPVDGLTRHRVYVEPKLDKVSLEAVAGEVERKLGIKGYITRYYP